MARGTLNNTNNFRRTVLVRTAVRFPVVGEEGGGGNMAVLLLPLELA